jgi:hypothetical protein
MARVEAMKTALSRSRADPGELDARLSALHTALQDIENDLYGNRAKRQIGEKTKPTIGDRLFSVELGVGQSTYGPTATHLKTMLIVNEQLQRTKTDLANTQEMADELGDDLLEAGAPWVEGNPLPQQEVK